MTAAVKTAMAGLAIPPLLLVPRMMAQQPVLGDVITPQKRSAMERQLLDVANATGLQLADERQRLPMRRSIYVSPDQLVARLQLIEDKLQSIVIPSAEFRNMTIREAVFHLRELILKHDEFAGDPAESLNLMLRFSGDEVEAERTINLTLTKVTARQAILKVAEAFGLNMEVTPYAVALRER